MSVVGQDRWETALGSDPSQQEFKGKRQTDLFRKYVRHLTIVNYVISPLGLSFSPGI